LSDIVVVLYSRLLVVETALSLLRNVVEHCSNIVKRVDDAQTYQSVIVQQRLHSLSNMHSVTTGCLLSITLST